jgi:hypothetical protein
MENTKHTPGPWTAGVTDSIWNDKGVLIAECGNSMTLGDSEVFSNARLIAAAPELLEACEDALLAMDSPRAYDSAVVASTLKAAVRKAKGE